MVNVNVVHAARLRALAEFLDAHRDLPPVLCVGTHSEDTEAEVIIAGRGAAGAVAWMDALPAVDVVRVWRPMVDDTVHADVYGGIGACTVLVVRAVESTILPTGVRLLAMTPERFRAAAAEVQHTPDKSGGPA